MSDNIDNVILEHLKAIRAEMASVKTDTREIRSRISSMESSLARLSRETSSNFEEIIENRHMVDELKERVERVERVERIERRLELAQ